jgi:hypothetical protein
MDAHESEYLAAARGMGDIYGITPTPYVVEIVGTREVPIWNVGATVCWTDESRHHRHGTVVDVTFAGPTQTADDRVYRVKEHIPGQPPRWHELTLESLITW